jgi:hypothetical protein
MPALENFEVKDGCGFYYPTGAVTAQSTVALIKRVMEACQEQGVKLLFLNASQVNSPVFTTLERYQIITEVEKFWDKSIKLAMVSAPDRFPPDDFGTNVAVNRGIRFAIFHDEQTALNWLTNKSSAG